MSIVLFIGLVLFGWGGQPWVSKREQVPYQFFWTFVGIPTAAALIAMVLS